MTIQSIKETILRRALLSGGENVISALSGGADSVALLFALNALKDELGFTLSACHVNHNLRGAESDADEAYCRELCQRLEITLEVRSIDVKSLQKKHQSLEECARDARYAFFDELTLSPNARIATAHSANDNAETVLLNLTRGTALKGLCGIPPKRGKLIRPLIDTSRAEIEAFCAENGLKYVTDKTNFSEDYTRNKLRLSVLPKLLEINPSLYAGLSRMCSSLTEDSAYLSEIAEKERLAAKTDGGYLSAPIAVLPSPIKSRIITAVLGENNISPSALIVSEISKILSRGSGKVNICRDTFAIVKRGVFKIERIVQFYRK